MPYQSIPTDRPLADAGDSRQPSHTGPNASARGKIFSGAA